MEEALAIYTATTKPKRLDSAPPSLGYRTDADDRSLVDELYQVLAMDTQVDFTLFFRRLANVPAPLDPATTDEALLAPLIDASYADASPCRASARPNAGLASAATAPASKRKARPPSSANSAWTR